MNIYQEYIYNCNIQSTISIRKTRNIYTIHKDVELTNELVNTIFIISFQKLHVRSK